MAYQYKEVSGSHLSMIATLNLLGEDGWDVASISVRPETDSFRAVMKRPGIERVQDGDPSRIAKLVTETMKGKKK